MHYQIPSAEIAICSFKMLRSISCVQNIIWNDVWMAKKYQCFLIGNRANLGIGIKNGANFVIRSVKKWRNQQELTLSMESQLWEKWIVKWQLCVNLINLRFACHFDYPCRPFYNTHSVFFPPLSQKSKEADLKDRARKLLENARREASIRKSSGSISKKRLSQNGPVQEVVGSPTEVGWGRNK